eukprot:9502799-Pyramimonas_sp.AAC.1
MRGERRQPHRSEADRSAVQRRSRHDGAKLRAALLAESGQVEPKRHAEAEPLSVKSVPPPYAGSAKTGAEERQGPTELSLHDPHRCPGGAGASAIVSESSERPGSNDERGLAGPSASALPPSG